MSNAFKKKESVDSNLHAILSQAELLKALSHQQSLVERKTTTPILSHVHLSAETESLLIIGTDLERTLEESIPAQIHQTGQTTVSAHTFRDLIRKFPEQEPITLFLSPEGLTIKNTFAQFVLPTLPAEDFPSLSGQELPYQWMISKKALSQLIDDTRFSMSMEEARYALNSIYFHYHDHQWRAVATDAHRLAMRLMPVDDPLFKTLPNILVGRKTIHELSKLLDDAPEEISLAISSRQLRLSFGDCVFSSRLLEGQFPDYWQAIPQEHPYVVELDVRSFSESIDRVGMVSSDKHRLVKCTFQHNELSLSAYSQRYGSGHERLLINYAGADMVIGFNPRYVLDICSRMKGATIALFLKDGISPALFKDPTDDKVLFVLMPMRL